MLRWTLLYIASNGAEVITVPYIVSHGAEVVMKPYIVSYDAVFRLMLLCDTPGVGYLSHRKDYRPFCLTMIQCAGLL